MKKQLLFLLLIFCCVKINAQSDALWKQSFSKSDLTSKVNSRDTERLYYKLNTDFLQIKLASTTSKYAKSNTAEITIPNANGVLERFAVWESSNFDPELQAKYPEIRSYQGNGLDDLGAKIHFSVSPLGMQTMVFRVDKPTEFIEGNPEDKTEYILFTAKNKTKTNKLVCTTIASGQNNSSSKTAKTSSNTKVFKKMRLALSCTGEYAQYFGGTKVAALSAMNATMTRVNGVFNKDLAVELILIANNDAVIYTNATTDPYSNANVGVNGAWATEVQNTVKNVIGEANYDIGHLFGATGGGGNAGCIGCVCISPTTNDPLGKGSAYTSPSDGIPEGDNFDINFVAHEIGHQLGATHTFSHQIEGTGTNVEPGSGSTIMGYAGITEDFDIQPDSDDYFAYASILQIQTNLANKSCVTNLPLTNNPPVVSAGANFTIPISTPFILTGTGSDPENDQLSFTWEQNDSAASTSGGNSIAYATKPDGPLFRSFNPGKSPVRYMPALNSVLQNRLTTRWESVSSIARTLNFSLTARDNAALGTAQTNTDEMIVNVSSQAGPFAITSQNNVDLSWDLGSNESVTWNVNNTNSLQGSSNVNIKLSTDGGITFPITLAANTPNDGSEIVKVPDTITPSTNCRVLVEPVGNIYYSINLKPFAIGYVSSTLCDTYSFGASYNIPFGNTFTEKTVNVPASTGTLSDVNVAVNVTHSRLSDLEMEIVSPSGTTVPLYNKDCSSNGTLVVQFDDAGGNFDCSKITTQVVMPVGWLSAFNGENPEGAWTFRVRDNVAGSFGVMNAASLNLCNQTFTLGTSDPKEEDLSFAIFPNPNKGAFTIQFKTQSKEDIKIYLHDILGKSVYTDTFQNVSNFFQKIELKNVSAGLYLLTIVDGGHRTVKKIVVY